VGAPEFFLINLVTYVVQTVAAAGACMFAWSKGGPGTRIAALAFGGGWIGWVIVVLAAPALNDALFPALTWDLLVALVFFYVAIRFGSLWIGAAMMAQGIQLGLRALDVFLLESHHSAVHLSLVVAINILNFVMMAMLVGAALAERRPPSRTRDERPSRAGDELAAS
jgi:hypothetical protein